MLQPATRRQSEWFNYIFYCNQELSSRKKDSKKDRKGDAKEVMRYWKNRFLTWPIRKIDREIDPNKGSDCVTGAAWGQYKYIINNILCPNHAKIRRL